MAADVLSGPAWDRAAGSQGTGPDDRLVEQSLQPGLLVVARRERARLRDVGDLRVAAEAERHVAADARLGLGQHQPPMLTRPNDARDSIADQAE